MNQIENAGSLHMTALNDAARIKALMVVQMVLVATTHGSAPVHEWNLLRSL